MAFLWLIKGYYQQGYELKQNTKALEMQADSLAAQVEELRNTNEQQAALAKSTQEQLELQRKTYSTGPEPDFELLKPQVISDEHNPKTHTLKIEILNRGGVAYNATFCSEELKSAGVPGQDHGSVTTGEVVTFEYTGPILDSFRFLITCRTSRLQHAEFRFAVLWDGDKHRIQPYEEEMVC